MSEQPKQVRRQMLYRNPAGKLTPDKDYSLHTLEPGGSYDGDSDPRKSYPAAKFITETGKGQNDIDLIAIIRVPFGLARRFITDVLRFGQRKRRNAEKGHMTTNPASSPTQPTSPTATATPAVPPAASTPAPATVPAATAPAPVVTPSPASPPAPTTTPVVIPTPPAPTPAAVAPTKPATVPTAPATAPTTVPKTSSAPTAPSTTPPSPPAPVPTTIPAPPAPHVVIVPESKSNFLAFVLGIVCAVGLIVSLLAGLYFYVYRDQNVVHETQHAFETQSTAQAEKARAAEEIERARSVQIRAIDEVNQLKQEVEGMRRQTFQIPPPLFQTIPPTTQPGTVPTPSQAPAQLAPDTKESGSSHTVTNNITVVHRVEVRHENPALTIVPNGYWPPTPMINRYGYHQQGFNGFYYQYGW